jgi:hypothetical protein
MDAHVRDLRYFVAVAEELSFHPGGAPGGTSSRITPGVLGTQ